MAIESSMPGSVSMRTRFLVPSVTRYSPAFFQLIRVALKGEASLAGRRRRRPYSREVGAPPAEDSPERAPVAAATGEADSRGRNRLTLPKGTAEQAVQALAFGSGARRRSRVTSRAAVAAFAVAKDEATKGAEDAEEKPDPTSSAATSPARATEPAPRSHASPDAHADEAMAEGHHTNGASIEGEAKPEARAPRRTRKAKHQGVPEGWVIDEEGFVVPGAG
jgi:hypothetical protein